MTGGTVVVIGGIGRNTGAGMTGGELFVWDPDLTARRHFAETAPPSSRLTDDDAMRLRGIVEEHVQLTGSNRAAAVLEDWAGSRDQFWVLRPQPPRDREIAAESEAVARS